MMIAPGGIVRPAVPSLDFIKQGQEIEKVEKVPPMNNTFIFRSESRLMYTLILLFTALCKWISMQICRIGQFFTRFYESLRQGEMNVPYVVFLLVLGGGLAVLERILFPL